MMRLSNRIRQDLITTLMEGAAYIDSLDLSRFFELGVREKQIGLIDYAIHTLYSHPYLTMDAFIEEGYSQQLLNRTIGDFEQFKSEIGLDRYTLDRWLEQNDDASGDVCMPYEVYQYFAPEVRAKYLSGLILKGVRVQLGSESLACIRLKCGTPFAIPKNTAEIAFYLQISRFGHYSQMHFSRSESVLTLGSNRIEICIYASQAKRTEDYTVCLIDDRELHDVQKAKPSIFMLQDFSIKHTSGINEECLKVLGLI
ncbi:hypothetical protein DZ860_11370 [Vibrio sinensis]|uniref:Uncharacterized protein n=1 Tax=Vibrio sinensis TaxID=2302434 RepID=A0A3A6QFG8_9VIBR|nr:hypothetical protein [Vibrio sinensis]RJX70927.1 hypothetical protein DZ860_11370 [Vibrio sinensis]